MNEFITINAPVQVPRHAIEDTLCAALEGGSIYWCEGMKVQTYINGAEWGHEQIARGGCVNLFYEDEWHTAIGSELRLREALTIMAQKYPLHFGDMMGDTGDAETGDILFQLYVFKEVVYG